MSAAVSVFASASADSTSAFLSFMMAGQFFMCSVMDRLLVRLKYLPHCSGQYQRSCSGRSVDLRRFLRSFFTAAADRALLDDDTTDMELESMDEKEDEAGRPVEADRGLEATTATGGEVTMGGDTAAIDDLVEALEEEDSGDGDGSGLATSLVDISSSGCVLERDSPLDEDCSGDGCSNDSSSSSAYTV